MDQGLKVEPVACHACGKQVWVGVMTMEACDEECHTGPHILHLDFLGGTLEQDDAGAFRPSVKHQYQIHEHQPERNK